MNRIDRLTAILIQLQTKKVVKAEEIADRFEISLRTVYRDVRALMEAGVPIGSEAGKGYFIVDGYHLPPVMFSQEEAQAMLTAGKLIEKLTDASIRTAYESALMKIKSVLNEAGKNHLENLQSAIEIFRSDSNRDIPDQHLADIQKAIAAKQVIQITYSSISRGERTERQVEPIGIVYYSGFWHLIAWCQLRKDYRDFRMDLIEELRFTTQYFRDSSHPSLKEYFNSFIRANQDVQEVIIRVDREIEKYIRNIKYYYGFVSEEWVDDQMRMTFLIAHFQTFGRWMLQLGNQVVIESPPKLREVIAMLVEELSHHYKKEMAEN